MPAVKTGSRTDWIEQISLSDNEKTRRRLLQRHIVRGSNGCVDRLYAEVVRLARMDLHRASRVAQALQWLAADLQENYGNAQSLRAQGHISYLSGNYREAVGHHQAALKLFQSMGIELDSARAMMNQLQPLIYLGEYKPAFDLAEKARAIFHRLGDEVRLARLDTNMGNILYRQDRFARALELYRRAYNVLIERGDTQDVAIVLRNMAVCYISLNRFDQALETYREAREHCDRHGLALLTAECDYNIAYLHYIRGEYTKALELYGITRALCEGLSDPYHCALCDLDQSELYVELNLSEEGQELARRACEGFEKLGMGYEAAKAVTFEALALSQQRETKRALEMFRRARSMFQRESNEVWPAVIDICCAAVLIEAEDYRKARQLCESARAYFSNSPLVTRTAVCELLLAKLDLQAGSLQNALDHCNRALDLLAGAEAPAIEFQANFMLGSVQEALGLEDAAYLSYLNAHRYLEGLRSHLVGEDFKIAFLKDKLKVYENLVCLSLRPQVGPRGPELAFDFIERAKSRSLADLISSSLHAVLPKSERSQGMADQVKELREQLSLAYRHAQQEEMKGESGGAERAIKLRAKSRAYQTKFDRVFTRLGSSEREYTALVNAGTLSLETIRSTIPDDSMILEYYQARGILYVCLLTRTSLEVVPLGPAAPVREIFRFLQFQLSKFRLGQSYLDRFQNTIRGATDDHLQELHRRLVAPIRHQLRTSHLIVVPHGFLHYLPFHALQQEGRYLIDDFSLSYAPSASVYALCALRPASPYRQSLVLGIPDRFAPYISDETRAVGDILPHARVCLGEGATREVLWEYAPRSRFVHIATHGLFRQDNPMFSSIRLGGSELNLFDLYRLRLSSELITLSGCGTGLNVVVGGDELLGLVRGLLYAGTQALMVTLWEVNDASTSEFMQAFYRCLSTEPNKALALRKAMKSVRESNPLPYYWAPFVLIGKYDSAPQK